MDEEHGVRQVWQNGQEAECDECGGYIVYEWYEDESDEHGLRGGGMWYHARIDAGTHEAVPNMLTMVLGQGVAHDPDGEPGGLDWI